MGPESRKQKTALLRPGAGPGPKQRMGERDEDEEEESQVVRKGDDAKAHKELNQLGGDMDGEKEVDTGKAQDALTKLASAEEAEKARRLERERELAKVKIEKSDVELIVTGKQLNK